MTVKGNNPTAFASWGVLRSLDVVSGDLPIAPSLAISVSGTTATATIDGNPGVTNYLKYKASSDSDWTDGGNRSGDGTIAVGSLAYNKHYIFMAYSKDADGLVSTPSIGIIILITATNSGIHATVAAALVPTQLSIFGVTVIYDTVGGSQYTIVAIMGPEQIQRLEDDYGISQVRTREAAISLDDDNGYSDPTYQDQITVEGVAWKVTDVSKVDAMATLTLINKADLEKHHSQFKQRMED